MRSPRRREGAGSGVERRIFVVGVPRSGTTLVQSLLAAHSELTSFTESHFFSRHFRALPVWPWAVLTRDPSPRVREFLAENDADPAVADETMAGVGRWLAPLRTRAVARQLLGVLDRVARSGGGSSWIEKTPRHLRYLPFLVRLAPRVEFVHVIRDGLETVASLHKASESWEVAYDLETCVARWNADVAFSLGRVRSPRDHFVVYEDLTSRPQAVLQRLLAGLGLAWEPEILERCDAGRLITPEETWKAGVDRGIRRSGTSRQVLSREQRERVRASLRHDLYVLLRERTP